MVGGEDGVLVGIPLGPPAGVLVGPTLEPGVRVTVTHSRDAVWVSAWPYIICTTIVRCPPLGNGEGLMVGLFVGGGVGLCVGHCTK